MVGKKDRITYYDHPGRASFSYYALDALLDRDHKRISTGWRPFGSREIGFRTRKSDFLYIRSIRRGGVGAQFADVARQNHVQLKTEQGVDDRVFRKASHDHVLLPNVPLWIGNNVRGNIHAPFSQDRLQPGF